MSGLQESLLAWARVTLFHGTVLFALTWVLTRTVLKAASPRLTAALWLIVLAKFSVPMLPALPFSLSFSGLVERVTLPVEQLVATGSLPTASVTPWVWGYLAIVAVLLLRKARAFRQLQRQVSLAPLADESMQGLVRRLSARLGIAAPLARQTAALGGPFIFGWWRPTLVLPLLELEAKATEAVILHELAHLRRRDPWACLVQWLSGALFFFWPPVRLANARFDEARELACDELALQHSGLSRPEYAHTLVTMVRSHHPQFGGGALTMISHPSHLERRIDMLLKTKSVPAAKRVLGAGLLLWSALALAGSRSMPLDEATGVVDEDQIREVVGEHRGEIRTCYETALAKNSGLHGKIVIDFTIGREGSVTEQNIALAATTLLDTEVQQCIVRSVAGWRFERPTGGGVVHVSYPFLFINDPHPAP